MSSRIELIVKLAERCNINCAYCYYFEGNADRFKNRSALITNDTVVALGSFLSRAHADDPAIEFQIIFHGGEPLLLGKERFADLCRRLQDTLPPDKLRLCLQTNAMLVDVEWIELFEEFRIGVSTSVDGPAAVHDEFRLDKKNRGTYDRTARGIGLLREAVEAGRLDSLGCLVYINPKYSGKAIYEHITQNLGIRTLDFLLPDTTHDQFRSDVGEYARYLVEVFDAWWDRGDSEVHLRIMKSVASLLLGGKSYLAGFGGDLPTAFTISSDGWIELDDFLRVCGDDVIATPLHVSNASLNALRKTDSMQLLTREAGKIPNSCDECAFRLLCRGGQITHRFKRGEGFQNRSVYCAALYSIFSHAAIKLVDDGVPVERIRNSINGISPRNASEHEIIDAAARTALEEFGQ